MGKASQRKKTKQNAKVENPLTKKTSNKGKYIGGAVVAAVALGIIGVAVVARPDGGVQFSNVDASAPVPANVAPAGDPFEFGYVYGERAENRPVLEVWEDFQCPACANFEATAGPIVKKMADEGLATVIFRPTTFLDNNLRNSASKKMTAAWGCAADAGKGMEFHDIAFASQPQEGSGYTDDDVKRIADTAGITGAERATFDQCVADRKYEGWAENSTSVFFDKNLPGTPYIALDGKELPTGTLYNEQALRETLTAAAVGLEKGTESNTTPADGSSSVSPDTVVPSTEASVPAITPVTPQ